MSLLPVQAWLMRSARNWKAARRALFGNVQLRPDHLAHLLPEPLAVGRGTALQRYGEQGEAREAEGGAWAPALTLNWPRSTSADPQCPVDRGQRGAGSRLVSESSAARRGTAHAGRHLERPQHTHGGGTAADHHAIPRWARAGAGGGRPQGAAGSGALGACP